MSPQQMNILGLIANAIGVVILFRFAMPYRISSAEGEPIVTGNVSASEGRLDSIYRRLGYLGLALVAIGTLLQIGANT
jgi:uncharacterized protein YjeT (DUF2065 family)